MKNIVLGTWAWGTGSVGGDEVFGKHLEAGNLKKVFDAAMRDDMNYWDTAYVYGMGASEEILASFTKPLPRESYRISTKFTPQFADMTASNPVEAMLDMSLKRFGIEYVDMFWIHNPADVEKWTPMLVPLVKVGKARKIGLSNHNFAQLKRASEILAGEGIQISAIQNHCSLLYRVSQSNGVLDWCKENNVEFWAYMVLEQGALSGKYDKNHPMPEGSMRAKTYNPLLQSLEPLLDLMNEIGKRRGISPAQVAISWAASKGLVPIIGVTTEQQVEEASNALDARLTDKEVGGLEDMADKSGVNTEAAWERI